VENSGIFIILAKSEVSPNLGQFWSKKSLLFVGKFREIFGNFSLTFVENSVKFWKIFDNFSLAFQYGPILVENFPSCLWKIPGNFWQLLINLPTKEGVFFEVNPSLVGLFWTNFHPIWANFGRKKVPRLLFVENSGKFLATQKFHPIWANFSRKKVPLVCGKFREISGNSEDGHLHKKTIS